jgi:acyl-CoA synthetase (AMP-forming)/AMP-acid ligase II
MIDKDVLQIKLHKRRGVNIVSSGTTGEPKLVHRTPENLEACNKVAINVQMLTSKSKVFTCTKLDHAGGLLLQTLPAYTLGCDIHVTKFNPFTFLKEFQNYTHTFLVPKMCQALMKTKGFATCELTGKVIAMGSDPIESYEIKAFIDRGAIVIANWGMSEIGPNTINKTFRRDDTIDFTQNIMGDTAHCDTKIVDGELYVKGDICVNDDWLATGDLVEYNDGIYWYYGRV